MFSLKNTFHQTLSKIITLAFTGFFGISSLMSGVNKAFPEVPEEFAPVLRFAVCSDLHLSSEESGVKNQKKTIAAIEKVYELSENSLDAFIVVGDFTERGKNEEYEIFSSLMKENIKGKTKLLTCLGNHEFIDYRDNDATVAYDIYKQYVNESVDTHEVIGGYHFIGVSYDDTGEEKFDTKTEWLKAELDKAVKDTGDKPIFVYQHPHPTMTVYGSINWSSPQIRSVLSKYPQVVDFSGHSHYSANDPRSVWQGAFTAVGCGGITGSMGNLSYISGDAYGDGESGTFWFVEVDKDGNVRMRAYDIVSDCFFTEAEYYFTNLGDKKERRYTWLNRYLTDTAPEFPDGAEITLKALEDGTTQITFPEASGYYKAENYKIAVKQKGEKVKSFIVLSDYIRATDEEKAVNIGEVKEGVIEIKVTAYSPYARHGESLSYSK